MDRDGNTELRHQLVFNIANVLSQNQQQHMCYIYDVQRKTFLQA